jgi:hypothetical protein
MGNNGHLTGIFSLKFEVLNSRGATNELMTNH